MSKRPTVLVIAGSDPSAGAGIQLDIPVLHSLGCHAAAVVTSITAQNSEGVSSVRPLPAQWVREQLDAVVPDVDFDAVKIGMVGSPQVANAILDWLTGKKMKNIVMDPIIQASDGTLLCGRSSDSEALLAQALSWKEETPEENVPSSAVDYSDTDKMDLIVSLTKLARASHFITPNLAEAAMLLGLPESFIDESDEQSVAEQLAVRLDSPTRWIFLKGGHRKGEEAVDLLYDCHGGESSQLKSPRVNKHVRGTGCYLSSALTGFLARGLDPLAAAQQAKAAVYEAIQNAERIGKGAFQIVPKEAF